MTNLALILVTDPEMCLQDHTGIPLLKRTVLSAQKGGIQEFIVLPVPPAPTNENTFANQRLRALLTGDPRIFSKISWGGPGGDNLTELLEKRSPKTVFIIRAETVFDPDVVREMADAGLDGVTARVAVRNGTRKTGPGDYEIKLDGDNVSDCRVPVGHPGSPAPATNVRTAGLVFTTPGAARDITMRLQDTTNGRLDADTCAIVEALLPSGNVKAVDVTKDLCMEITSQQSMDESKNKLYGRLTLETDSPFSVHVSRKISRLVTGVMVELPITPNQITLLSLVIGLAACWLYLQGGYWYSVLGAMTLYASIILDLSDGEVARLKFMSSKYGALLDSLCDSTVFSGVLFCAAVAIHRNLDAPNIITVGAVAAVVMFICSDLYFYLHSVREEPESDPANSILRSFANEDSFFLSLLGFTLLNSLEWYLWAVAAGSIVYLFTLVADLNSNEPSHGSESVR
ncbi:MAG: CDP-alcohol phosphatidyltransferase family protein [Planctomycetes bacterium]|nr:CDP-alcohol phosphatidyltransferase family protein [Planctomycetota bacterium]